MVEEVERRMQRPVMPPKSKEGTMPINSLPSTAKIVTFCHADKAAGRLPVRELPHTTNCSRSTKALAASDTVPRRLLLSSILRHREKRREEKGWG